MGGSFHPLTPAGKQLISLGKKTKKVGPNSETVNFSWWYLDLSDKPTTQNNEVENQSQSQSP